MRERLEKMPDVSLIRACRMLLEDRAVDEVGKFVEDLRGALSILSRLVARRYSRAIFRLLPNAEIPQLNMDPSQISAIFLNASKRASAERKIEALAGLPRGTVTIHCPSNLGPRKIAEILILNRRSDGLEIAVPLRELGRIDREIFQKHEEAITAVEDMYASMWRLTVSVAPPYHQEYEELNAHIGRVLFAVLSGESYEDVYDRYRDSDRMSPKIPRVPNDPRKEEELAGLAEAPEDADRVVSLVYEDGRRVRRPEAFVEVADIAAGALIERDNRIAGYIQNRFAANSPTAPELQDIVRSRIRIDEPPEEQGDLMEDLDDA
jgi:hypothetical protein